MTISSKDVSKLIGLVYDCAVDPSIWVEAVGKMCHNLDFVLGSIMIFDLMDSKHKRFCGWNDIQFAEDSIRHYAEDATAIYRSANPLTTDLGDVMAISLHVPREIYESMPYYQKLLKPMGICDSVQTVVLRDIQHQRIGVFALNRHESAGVVTEREVSVLRLLGPHIRRAVTISDLLNLNAAKKETLSSCLDALSTGAILVGAQSEILHANRAAERMLESSLPVRSVNGRLATLSREATAELRQTVDLAQRDDASIGAHGIGLPLPRPDDVPAIAHVLPLARGELRRRLAPQGVAAVFIADADAPRPPAIEAAARLFGLSAAEARVLSRLTEGKTVAETAASLGLSEATVRSHVQRIFRKAEVSRLPDLMALVDRLTPPVADRP